MSLFKEKSFRAIKHQSFVVVGYFDQVNKIITGGSSSTAALKGPTEEEQFNENETDRREKEIAHKNKIRLSEQPLPNLTRKRFRAK